MMNRAERVAVVAQHMLCPCGCGKCRECQSEPWRAEHVVDLLDGPDPGTYRLTRQQKERALESAEALHRRLLTKRKTRRRERSAASEREGAR